MTALERFIATGWKGAACEPLAHDASARRYFRLRNGGRTAIVMDASNARASIAPFARISGHLQRLGFSAPAILQRDDAGGFLLLEDFGDDNFSRLLENPDKTERLLALAVDVLAALHKHSEAIPTGLRAYGPEEMLADLELFLEQWPTPENGKQAFRKAWLEALPQAHRVPVSLLLRDYHAANLMWLREREGIRQAGLLDFQDAWQGPVTYDLVSLLEDARHDLSPALREKMKERYVGNFSHLNREIFETSLAILAALRHTRVLAIFEKLNRQGRTDYKKFHSPRVRRLLQKALGHPALRGVQQWFCQYAPRS
ncbi:MAG: phosphotransferase [Verrucomicrobia bacterium]|nr:phosphotransferase [Verrucomicrobiota bacterium]MDE3098344.1 phosphotransferase [Verrucomicrobiota bacterium]